MIFDDSPDKNPASSSAQQDRTLAKIERKLVSPPPFKTKMHNNKLKQDKKRATGQVDHVSHTKNNYFSYKYM